MKDKTIIIAPHADDEIIGCFEVLTKAIEQDKEVLIVYGSYEASKEGKHVWKGTKVECKMIDSVWKLPDKKDTYYFPDPYFETHPLHRKLGGSGEEMVRAGYNVVFYSTNMQAPYIREVKNPNKKRNWLDDKYHLKRSLWQYDYKYFLFEGYVKWIML